MKDRIYQLMKSKGMSQKEFANELCIAEGTLSSIFSGRTKASSNIVYSIHERFPEISIPWLMFGEGEMTGSSHQDNGAGSTMSAIPSPTTTSPDLFQDAHIQSSIPMQMKEVVKYIEKPQRQITEIRVFFDDGTYQTFGA